ncbi:MAG: choice-of-anchor L domain-containing protein, partial [Bacteroidota bacterium]
MKTLKLIIIVLFSCGITAQENECEDYNPDNYFLSIDYGYIEPPELSEVFVYSLIENAEITLTIDEDAPDIGFDSEDFSWEIDLEGEPNLTGDGLTIILPEGEAGDILEATFYFDNGDCEWEKPFTIIYECASNDLDLISFLITNIDQGFLTNEMDENFGQISSHGSTINFAFDNTFIEPDYLTVIFNEDQELNFNEENQIELPSLTQEEFEDLEDDSSFDIEIIYDNPNDDCDPIAQELTLIYNDFVIMDDHSVSTCYGTLYDSGGPDGGFSNGEDYTLTICPGDDQFYAALEFYEFNIPSSIGELSFYDGTDVSAPLIGTFSGNLNNNEELLFITASETNPSRCLTLNFTSQINIAPDLTGFEASIICRPECPEIEPELVSFEPGVFLPNQPGFDPGDIGGGIGIDPNPPIDFSDGVIQIGQGATIQFEAEFETFFDPDTDYLNYDEDEISGAEWTIGNQTSDDLNPSFTFNNEPGTVLDGELILYGDYGCESNVFNFTVEIMSPYIFLDEDYSVQELVEDVLVGDACFVDNISSPTNSSNSNLNFESFGYFERAFSDFPFEDGIVMGSGSLESVLTTNTSVGNWEGDDRLDLVSSGTSGTNDATIIEFEFTPLESTVSFNYIFASYEYPTYICNFADPFAFILSGPDIDDVNLYDHDANPNNADLSLDLGGLNIAVAPNTNIPTTPTNIHNESCASGLGQYALPEYFDQMYPAYHEINGQTQILTAEAEVTPCETYTITLAISDYGDSSFDSYVFLEGGSFNIGADLGDDITLESGNTVCEGDIIDLEIFGGEFACDDTTAFWYLDDQILLDENEEPYEGATYQATETGVYTVRVVQGDLNSDDYDENGYPDFSNNSTLCASEDQVFIEFVPVPTIEDHETVTACEAYIGPTIFDLTVNNELIYGEQSEADFEIVYYPTESDAVNQTNPIEDPENYETFLVDSEASVYARIQSVAAEGACFEIEEIDLLGGFLEIEEIPNAESCSIEQDADTALFDFTQIIDYILEDIEDETINSDELEFSFFTSEDDAIANENTIENFEEFEAENGVPIFVRIDDLSNIDEDDEDENIIPCFTIFEFETEILVRPIIDEIESLEECGDFTYTQEFDLTAAENYINEDNIYNVEITGFYLSEVDAENEENTIDNPGTYTAVNDDQTIYVRAEYVPEEDEEIQVCHSVTPFQLILHNTEAYQPDPLEECENQNGAGIFDLTQVNGQVLGASQYPLDYSITFHISEADAEGGVNPIADPTEYENTSNPQTIWVRNANLEDPENCY